MREVTTLTVSLLLHADQGKMLDLVFAVRDSELWHEENMARNPEHYSALKWMGPKTVAHVQRASAGVYYNTLVTVDSQVVHA